MNTLEGKYIGPDKIKVVKPLKEKTYLGNERVDIKFDGGGKIELPKEVAESIASKESYDLTELQEKRIRPVVEKILVLLTESELSRDDIQALIQLRLPDSILKAKEMANERMWGKKDYEVTLFDIDKVLQKK